jgi:ligand-binding SRPBCC domain-containing protein
MKLCLKTNVDSPPEAVWEGFDEALFLQLAPPLPRIRLLQFDGCLRGNEVRVELNFVFFKQEWISLITEQGQNETEIWFVDEGEKLPFFLRAWRHRHRILRVGSGSQIVDEIEYRSPLWLLDVLLYPSLWLQFAYRKPIYRRVFSSRTDNSTAK